MQRLAALLCAALVVTTGLGQAAAHHVSGHGGGGSNFYNPFSTQSRPPRTFLSFTFNVDALDDGLGEVLRYQLAGEYAVHRRFSVGMRLPFLSIREKFLPRSDGIGDVALSFKGLLWSQPSSRMNLTLGGGFSFPTGDEAKGLGAGDVLVSPFLNYTAGLGPVDFYTTVGTTLAAADQVSPTLDYQVGANIPVIKGKIPLHLFVAFQGSTSVRDDVFASGSTKAYITPGLILYLRDDLITTFGARVSVLDTLEVKPGVALSKTSTSLLSDVLAGFNFNVDYFF
ncbi:MAG: transporter [Deltaproteobacteria bacterium]|nr:transporter [Deltaproteobacteria bacterium]